MLIIILTMSLMTRTGTLVRKKAGVGAGVHGYKRKERPIVLHGLNQREHGVVVQTRSKDVMAVGHFKMLVKSWTILRQEIATLPCKITIKILTHIRTR